MTNLILASTSQTRARLLRAAGVKFEALPSRVDEAEVKAALLAEGFAPAAIADALAEMKALRLSTIHPEALVLGCDQILEFEGRLIDKSESLEEARALLLALAGKSHSLVTAAVLAKGGMPIWRKTERAELGMRAYGEDFLADYLAGEGEAILSSVGCYHLEGRGVQLFERVEGDYFSILGLPLLPLLAILREHEVVGR
jgi:septum formation protein